MIGEKGGYIPPDALSENAGHQPMPDEGPKYVVPEPKGPEGDFKKVEPKIDNPHRIPENRPDEKK